METCCASGVRDLSPTPPTNSRFAVFAKLKFEVRDRTLARTGRIAGSITRHLRRPRLIKKRNTVSISPYTC